MHVKQQLIKQAVTSEISINMAITV